MPRPCHRQPRLHVRAAGRRGDAAARSTRHTGKVLWRTAYSAPFTISPAAARHEKGPKSTPTFADGKLFTLGMTGIVTAFDAATGKRLWQKPASQPASRCITRACRRSSTADWPSFTSAATVEER